MDPLSNNTLIGLRWIQPDNSIVCKEIPAVELIVASIDSIGPTGLVVVSSAGSLGDTGWSSAQLLLWNV